MAPANEQRIDCTLAGEASSIHWMANEDSHEYRYGPYKQLDSWCPCTQQAGATCPVVAVPPGRRAIL